MVELIRRYFSGEAKYDIQKEKYYSLNTKGPYFHLFNATHVMSCNGSTEFALTLLRRLKISRLSMAEIW